MIEHEGGDDGVEGTGPEGKGANVGGCRRRTTGPVVSEHRGLDVALHHVGAELTENRSGDARSGTGVEHEAAGQRIRAAGDEVPGQRLVHEAGISRPGWGGSGVATPRTVRHRYSHAAPSSATRSHHASSASSPRAFSHANVAITADHAQAELAVPPTCGVHAVVLERPAVGGDRVLLRARQPIAVEGEVPGQLPARRRLARIGPVEHDRSTVGTRAEVAELPIAGHERLRGRREGGSNRRRVGVDRLGRGR